MCPPAKARGLLPNAHRAHLAPALSREHVRNSNRHKSRDAAVIAAEAVLAIALLVRRAAAQK